MAERRALRGIEAAMRKAARDETVVCIESTSNQVNQSGGYTGMAAAGCLSYKSRWRQEAVISSKICGRLRLSRHWG